LRHRFQGARVLTGGLGFLLAAPAVLVAVGAPFVLRALPAYTALAESSRVTIGIAIFVPFALLTAIFLNLYNGPVTAATLDVVPANDRAAAGGTVLSLSHLLGDVYAGVLVGSLADFLSQRMGGDQYGLGAALLLVVPAALLFSGVVGIWGSRFYARDLARVAEHASGAPVVAAASS
jgi:hypothetical protein